MRDAANRSVNRGSSSDLMLRLREVVVGRTEAGNHGTNMRERAIELDEQLGSARRDDFVAGVGVQRLLQAFETLLRLTEIDQSQPDVVDARWQVPAERRE